MLSSTAAPSQSIQLESSRRSPVENESQQDPQDPPADAANAPAGKRDLITMQMIDEELAKVEKAELDELDKGAIVKHYVAARQYLALANTDAAEAAEYRLKSQSVVETREELRSKIDELDATGNVVQRPNGSLAELEQQKLGLENDAETVQQQLKLATEEPARRRARLLELPTLENDAQNRLAEVRVQLATEAPDADNPLLTRGRMVELRAEKQNLEQRLELYRVERDVYEATSGILSLQKSFAARQLERVNSNLKVIVDAIGRIREKETQDMRQEAEQAVTNNLNSPLKPIAEYNLQLAQRLAKETDELQAIKALRSEGQIAVQKVEAELETMKSRVDAIGLNYEVGAMLRRDKVNLINQQTPFQNKDVASQLQSVQLNKFRFQDERADLSDMPMALTQAFDAANVPVEIRENLASTATELLTARRRILEKLEDAETDLLHDLIEVKSLQSQYANQSQQFADFLDERILWVRSEPAIGHRNEKGEFTDLIGIQKAFDWFAKPDNWRSVAAAISKGSRDNSPSVTLIALGLLGLALLQPRSRSEIKRLGSIAAKRGCREFGPTLSAFLQTAVLTFFWPAIGLALGWLMTTQNESNFSWSIGRALTVTTLIAITLELMRCVCRNEGLAQNHFSWTEGFRVAVRKHSGWFMAIGLPVLFIIVAIESSNENEYNRLGRAAVLVLLAVSIVFTLRIFSVFRPGGASFDPEMSGFDATVSRFRSLVFVAVIIGLVLLFLFAVLGYYESVYKIGASLLQSIQLLIWTVIVFGLAMRFFLVRRRNLRFEQLIQQRKAAIAAAEKQAESGISIASEALDIDLQNESGMDITDVSRQARELTGVIFLIVVGLSLLGIWQYLLPATKILDSWELWRITVGSAVELVTARDLLLSLVAFAITFFCVRNIPGMLELLLLQRLPLDAGARYAVASIFRYILLVVGVIVALGYLKIPWSNYSWLVAAISVGLGFGLQEIVANFVSGLILLLERPVRVGDVVTIDGVTGVVSRIQMRATTVTNWDNQELVVPNKDLISGKLLNWTLSSVINRIALKVGVAYGTDVGKVREIITKIVDRHPDVLKEPAAVITFEEFGDSSLNFVIRCCTTSIKRRWHLVDEINSAINEAFVREGIEIPFPQRVLHMVEDPATGEPPQSSGAEND
ncbi:mechanosensitive ion channel domain-containing protein [Mariniblastus fucicola]|nr:mechanosensitive ion channel domain-containing protein [Mariniblastus fucicola]